MLDHIVGSLRLIDGGHFISWGPEILCPNQLLVSHSEEWTIEKLKAAKVLMKEGKITQPSEVYGVVEFSIWDFLEVNYYIYPMLHGEIGLVNI